MVLNFLTMQPEASRRNSENNAIFTELARTEWAKLAEDAKLSLTDAEIARIRSLGDELDLHEVNEVYLPLSKLLAMYVIAARSLHNVTEEFLGIRGERTPFIIGVAGSVAVGKSTVARLLQELLRRWEETPRVELITTDGFLWPNAELESRGLMERKGFPESYDRRSLLRFVASIKSGAAEAKAPVYSHLSYDILPEKFITVHKPDVLIVEGLNVLQPPAVGSPLALSDLFDFSIYVDASVDNIAHWYEERFLKLQRSAFADPKSYFHRYADFTEDEARSWARNIWASINEPNLTENIKPTRPRADLVLRKGADHAVHKIFLRKI